MYKNITQWLQYFKLVFLEIQNCALKDGFRKSSHIIFIGFDNFMIFRLLTVIVNSVIFCEQFGGAITIPCGVGQSHAGVMLNLEKSCS